MADIFPNQLVEYLNTSPDYNNYEGEKQPEKLLKEHPTLLYDFLLASSKMRLNPYPVYKFIRENTPIFYSNFLLGWFVSGYDFVQTIFKHKGVSANRGPMLEKQLEKAHIDAAILEQFPDYKTPSIIWADGKEHQTLKGIANRGFTPKALKTYEETIKASIQKVVSELKSGLKNEANFDLYEGFAKVFPYRAITSIMGVPEEKYHTLMPDFRLTEQLFSGAGDDLKQTFTQGNEAQLRIDAYFEQLAKERKENPSDDMLSFLTGKEELLEQKMGGETEKNESAIKIAKLAATLVIAGSTTLTHQVPLALWALAHNKEQFKLFRTLLEENDSKAIDNALEELMRMDSTLQYTHRIATEDIQLGTEAIKKGDVIVLSIGAANHDTSHFSDTADDLDLKRENAKEHFGFGHSAHHCIGRSLAKFEMEVAFRTLFDQFENLTLNPHSVAEPTMDTGAFKGFMKCPVMNPNLR